MNRPHPLPLATALLLAAALLAACAAGPPPPTPLDTRNEACRHCRMLVSDPKSAAQLVAPGEEPLFFDDVGCLRDYLGAGRVPRGAMAYVADHRTGAWVPAARAVYTRAEGRETPMGSHLLAHAGAASRDADPAAAGGVTLSARQVFGPAGPPEGAR
jgi:copper chaperone NosL